MFDTIVALATPQIKSALGIIRLSGDDCFDIANKIFSKEISGFEKNKIYHGFIKDNKEIIDEIVLLAYKNPFSFTGEDSCEIICHGSPLIENEIIELCIKNGARLAERGEFSSRSYLHGKVDLVQAESINDLINAESKESKNLSLNSLSGETSKLILPIKQSLGDLLSLIEVNINYPEYTDIEEATYSKVEEVSMNNLALLKNLISEGSKAKIIKDGISVALVGKPNVGKSSVLNALIGEDKAIVTDIKGTTRDVVEGSTFINGIKINFFDTAGIRDSKDKIELIGIEKSKEIIKKSDYILFICDADEFNEEDKTLLSCLDKNKTIVVYNKSDLLNKLDSNKVYVSAINNDVESIKKCLYSKFNLSEDNFKNPSLNNARQIGILKDVYSILEKLIKLSNDRAPIDIVSVEVERAYKLILSIVGEDYDFDIANEIFSRFCLGK